MKLLLKTPISNDLASTFSLFNEDLFKALKPPIISLKVDRFDGCHKGDEVHLEIGLGPLKQKWVSLITDDKVHEDVCYFIDEGTKLPPPLTYWKHIHRIVKVDNNNCVIEDDITFSSGNTVLDALLYPVMYAQFALRAPIYKKLLNRSSS
jgi:ligand-binding SRPBCC domain-containing protein